MSLLTRWAARRYGGMAALYEHFTAPMERAGLAAIRAELAAEMHGRIIEVGCGTGLNFAHYPAGLEVAAIEPLEEFRTCAALRAQRAQAHIVVQDGDAQALPFPDASFDGALQTLVFCSVPNDAQGLLELRRVLRPGSPVRFFEHVRSDHALGAVVQDIFNPLWRWAMDGCNINRDTVRTIERCGFRIDAVQAHDMPGASLFPMRLVRAHV
ncbi:MAG: class I SAM-dependent methyltransferase [Candidatus Binatia bacterium]